MNTEYLELIRLAIALRLYVLTGMVWRVELEVENLDFQFRMSRGEFGWRGTNFDVFDLMIDKLPKWPDLVYLLCNDACHYWLRSLRLFPNV